LRRHFEVDMLESSHGLMATAIDTRHVLHADDRSRRARSGHGLARRLPALHHFAPLLNDSDISPFEPEVHGKVDQEDDTHEFASWQDRRSPIAARWSWESSPSVYW